MKIPMVFFQCPKRSQVSSEHKNPHVLIEFNGFKGIWLKKRPLENNIARLRVLSWFSTQPKWFRPFVGVKLSRKRISPVHKMDLQMFVNNANTTFPITDLGNIPTVISCFVSITCLIMAGSSNATGGGGKKWGCRLALLELAERVTSLKRNRPHLHLRHKPKEAAASTQSLSSWMLRRATQADSLAFSLFHCLRTSRGPVLRRPLSVLNHPRKMKYNELNQILTFSRSRYYLGF